MTGWNDGGVAVSGALWIERARGNDGMVGLAQLRHPGYAWLDSIAPGLDLDEQVQAAASGYLAALAKLEPALDGVVAVLGKGPGDFGWLPVTWGLDEGPPDDLNPNTSFLLTRADPTGGPKHWREATLLLLAARQLHRKAVGDGVGLRVTVHVQRDDDSSRWQLRFASLVCSRLDQVVMALPESLSRVCTPEIRAAIEQALSAKHVAVHALHGTADADMCELQGLAVRVRTNLPSEDRRFQPRAQVFGFSVQLDLTKPTAIQTQSFGEVSARMQAIELFERDPASMGSPDTLDQRRPSRASKGLDAFREYHTVVPHVQASGRVSLRHPDGLFYVTHERSSVTGQPGAADAVGRQSKSAVLPKTSRKAQDPLQFLPLRSDNLAAAQAYARGQTLFDRLAAYGFNPRHYFRHARLPLELRPRARLQGAADGRAVNAEVRPFFRNSNPDVDLLSGATNAKFADLQRPQLQVRLGSADTKVRHGAQTLGLAADPRWAWHEFGHVLNYAATGELEFAFAHSAGDALAAISTDPDSLLATAPNLRGYTFPWAFVHRRHDRLADQGYCWCGVRNGARQRRMSPFNNYRHGYFEEELLSSSLFRLYLSLGGATGVLPDTEPLSPAQREDLAIRRSASDYCVYLIMHAIALLGPNGIAPARTADQFVGALIDADLGTGPWRIDAQWPYREEQVRTVLRHGGRVHKVIRWAFEQQGLYATHEPGETVEGPGLPPTVDVYIADQRGGAAGGYAPVPLRWHDDGQVPWYADAKAITRSMEGQFVVRVAERSGQRVQDLAMRMWVSALPGSALQWHEIKPVANLSDGVFTADLAKFQGQPLWVFASVHAAADPSNLPTDALAPPTEQAALIELVANDNNLALAFLA